MSWKVIRKDYEGNILSIHDDIPTLSLLQLAETFINHTESYYELLTDIVGHRPHVIEYLQGEIEYIPN